MRTRGFFAFLLVIPVTLGAVQKPPSKAEPLLKVHVYAKEQPGDPGPSVQKGSVSDAVGELRKKIKGRKKWFEVVDTQEQAEISVGVTAYGIEKVSQLAMESAGASRDGAPITREVMVVKERHHIQASIALPLPDASERTLVRQGEGKSLGEAADGLTKGLEEFCKTNYSKLSRK